VASQIKELKINEVQRKNKREQVTVVAPTVALPMEKK